MSANIANAINAYRNVAQAAGPEPGARGPDQNDEFSDLVRATVNRAIEIGRAGEQKSMQAIAGTAELNEVITAVSNAEVTLQTAVTIRDRVIQAYQEILRMPI